MFFKAKNLIFLLLTYTSILSCDKKETTQETVFTIDHKHPYAKKKPFSNVLHGITLNDEYHWMEDKENQEVLDYLQEENRYVDSIMQYPADMQENIYQELLNRTAAEYEFLNSFEGTRYYSQKNPEQLYPIIYKTFDVPDVKEEIVIDFNESASPDKELYVNNFEISPDQQHLAYVVKEGEAEDFSLVIQNIRNKAIADTVPGVYGSIVWAEDSQTIFYTVKDEQGRADKVFNHKIYLPYEEDKMEYYEEDSNFHVSIEKAKNNAYIFIKSESTHSSETHYLSADDPNQNFKLFSSRMPDQKYQVYPHSNNFYVLTESGNEKKLMKATEGATDVSKWQMAEANNNNYEIHFIDVYEKFLVLYKSEKDSFFIEIKDFTENKTNSIYLDENIISLDPITSTPFKNDVLQFQYVSLLSPLVTVQINMRNKEKKFINKKEVPDFNADLFQIEKIYVQAGNDVSIPVSLVYKTGLNKDGTAPLYFYGLSSLKSGSLSDPASSIYLSNIASLLNRGFIFAIAHLDEPIYNNSNNENVGQRKENETEQKKIIQHYLLCAEYLIQQNYTSSDKFIAYGEGMEAIIVGSAVNIDPKIFQLVVMKNPKSDILQVKDWNNSMDSYNSFGDPKNENDFNYMLTFSPYDNIEVKGYPHFFLFSEFQNPEIPYYEASKWAARLREYNTNQNKLLLKTHFNNRRNTTEKLKDVALEYAFIIDNLKETAPDIKMAIKRP